MSVWRRYLRMTKKCRGYPPFLPVCIDVCVSPIRKYRMRDPCKVRAFVCDSSLSRRAFYVLVVCHVCMVKIFHSSSISFLSKGRRRERRMNEWKWERARKKSDKTLLQRRNERKRHITMMMMMIRSRRVSSLSSSSLSLFLHSIPALLLSFLQERTKTRKQKKKEG